MEKKIRGIMKYNKESRSILKESCQGALLALMEQKNYSEINITEICRKAGISRTGFYRNYASKDDIITEIISKMIYDISSMYGNVFLGDTVDAYEWYLSFFRFVLQKEKTYRILSKANLAYRMLTRTNEMILTQMGDIDDKEKACRLLWNGAIFNASICWVCDPNRVPAEKMAEWCLEYLTL